MEFSRPKTLRGKAAWEGAFTPINVGTTKFRTKNSERYYNDVNGAAVSGGSILAAIDENFTDDEKEKIGFTATPNKDDGGRIYFAIKDDSKLSKVQYSRDDDGVDVVVLLGNEEKAKKGKK